MRMNQEHQSRSVVFSDLFLHVFCLAARQAGLLAVRLQGEVGLQNKPGQSSPESAAVTSVDLAVQDVVLQLLLHRFAGAALDAEEDTELVTHFPEAGPGRPIIVIDPVDGSLNYAQGSQDYAVMGALLLDDRYLASVVHFPAWETTYWAQRGGGAWLQEPTGKPRQIWIDQSSSNVLIPPKSLSLAQEPISQAGYTAVESRCSAVDAIAPVTGRGCASISLMNLDRRRAIGYLISAEAGAAVRVGDQPWDGQDPERLSGPSAPSLAADSVATAERLSSLFEPASG